MLPGVEIQQQGIAVGIADREVAPLIAVGEPRQILFRVERHAVYADLPAGKQSRQAVLLIAQRQPVPSVLLDRDLPRHRLPEPQETGAGQTVHFFIHRVRGRGQRIRAVDTRRNAAVIFAVQLLRLQLDDITGKGITLLLRLVKRHAHLHRK